MTPTDGCSSMVLNCDEEVEKIVKHSFKSEELNSRLHSCVAYHKVIHHFVEGKLTCKHFSISFTLMGEI